MISREELIQIQYEIAMSIGNDHDLRKMLRESLTCILKKLNCPIGAVLLFEEINNKSINLNKVFSIPRKLDNIKAYKNVLENMPSKGASKNDFKEFCLILPLTYHVDGFGGVCILEIPDIGILLLIGGASELNQGIIESLRPNMGKYAVAIKSCLQNEELVLYKERLEEQLKLNAERLHSALEASNEGIFEVNFKTSENYLSPRWYTMLGYEPDEFEPEIDKVLSLTHPDDTHILADSIGRMRYGATETSDIEYRLKTKSGEWFWVLSRSKVVERDADNKVIRLIGTHIDINERKKTEEIIKQAESRLHQTQKMAKLGTWEFDVVSNEIYWSEETWRIWGKEPQQGGPDFGEYYESIHPDDRDLFNKSVEKAAKGSPYEIELRHLKPDGNYNHVITQCQPLEEDGKVIKLLGSILDITERKKIENVIRLSEENYRTVVENANEGLFIIQDNIIVYANKSAEETLGYKFEELSNIHFIDLIYDEDKVLVFENHQKRLKGEHVPIYHVRAIRKDGVVITIEMNATLFTYNGKPATLNFVNDITEKLGAEQELKENEARYRSFFSNSIEAMSIFDVTTFEFIDVNDAFCELYGYNKEEALQLNVKDVSAEVKVSENAIKKSAAEGNVNIPIRYHKKKDGTIMIVSISAGPFIWKGRKVMYSIIRDITEEYNNKLKIKEQNDALTELNATKDKFFSIIAHDLKSPFNSILGLTEILKEKKHSVEEYQDLNGKLYIEASRSYKLLENLLDWARMQIGGIPFKPDTFDISASINHVVELNQPMANKKNILIESFVTAPTKVKADREMINTVIRNLISNAIKFTPKGGKISVKALNHHKMFKLTVTDTGVGIDEAKVKDLFKIERTQNTRGTEDEGGTGLGLILCQEFIKKHNGKIEVESTKGEGTAISFLIPA